VFVLVRALGALPRTSAGGALAAIWQFFTRETPVRSRLMLDTVATVGG